MPMLNTDMIEDRPDFGLVGRPMRMRRPSVGEMQDLDLPRLCVCGVCVRLGIEARHRLLDDGELGRPAVSSR